MGIICRRRGAAKGGRQHIDFFFQNRFQWRHCDVTKSGADFSGDVFISNLVVYIGQGGFAGARDLMEFTEWFGTRTFKGTKYINKREPNGRKTDRPTMRKVWIMT